MSEDSYTAYEAKYATAERLRAAVLPRNKAVLFGALHAADITLVTVEFDGSGDDGQIENVTAIASGGTETSLPESEIEVETVEFDPSSIGKRTTTVRQYLEDFAYQLLERTHEGWENNDGAFGEFKFDITEQTITLEYNERYIETAYSEHSF